MKSHNSNASRPKLWVLTFLFVVVASVAVFVALPGMLGTFSKVKVSMQAGAVMYLGLSLARVGGLTAISTSRAVERAFFVGVVAFFVGDLCRALFPDSVVRSDWPGIIELIGGAVLVWGLLRVKRIV